MYINDRELFNFLKDSGLITRNDLQYARERSEKFGQHISHILVHDGLLSESEMRKIEARMLGISFVDLSTARIPYEVLKLIPEPLARKHSIVPFEIDGSRVRVAMLHLEGLHAIGNLLKGHTVTPYFTDEKSIAFALKTHQKYLKEQFGADIQKESFFLKEFKNKKIHEKNIDETITHPSVEKLLELLLNHATVSRVTDMHLETVDDELFIKYRIDGDLYDALALPAYVGESLFIKIKSTAGLSPLKVSVSQEGSFSMEGDTEKVLCKVITQPTVTGEKMVIKIVKSSSGFTLESLGFMGSDADIVYRHLRRQKGIVFVGGEKDSGVTTCLYTFLDLLSDSQKSIATLESPVEYRLGNISQIQVEGDTGNTYESGLSSLVKNDTDIVMVGDANKGETLDALIRTVHTGMYVLAGIEGKSTLHMLRDISQKSQFEDSGIGDVSLIISTKLVYKLSENKEQYFLTKKDIGVLQKQADLAKVHRHLVADRVIREELDWEHIPFYRNKAKKVKHTDRTAVYEVLPVTETLKDAIRANKTLRELEKIAYTGDTMSAFENGIYKAVAGIISLEDALDNF